MATTLLLVLGGAFITEQAGLSMALGAFIAGLLLAETEFRKQVEVDIMPFKGLLLGLFFMTVGMNFNLSEMLARFPLVVILSFALIFFKTLIVAAICILFKMDFRKGIKIGLLLSQASEFAFILFNLALSKGLIEEELAQTLLLVVSFTMAITPLMFAVASFYFNKVKKSSKQQKYQIKDTEDLKGHFIICGFGWMGENLARLFSMDNFSFVAIDDEPRRVKAGREMGMPVYYGDATRQEILNSLQVRNARAVIVTIHDTRPAQKIISSIRKAFPDKTIIARAKHVENIESIRKSGADIVIPEAYESSIQVAMNALKLHGLPDFDIDLIVENFRNKVHNEA
jgi:CPA2 family monovalent cation:H+ antiporter-2